MKNCLVASLFAALGAFLFGYHSGIIAGCALCIAKAFHLTLFQESLLVSFFLVGTIVGAFGGGALADLIGRKRTLLAMAFIFLASALCLAFAEGIRTIYIGRIFSGIAVGIASSVVPLYIAEISPVEKRGAYVCISQVMITLGVLVSFLVSWFLWGKGDWRGMFLFAAYPAAILLGALFFIPDSIPFKKTDQVGAKISSAPLLIGSFLNVLQQVTGINIIICFIPRIFQLAGIGETGGAVQITVWVGIVNVAATLLGLWIVDRVGRRPLALLGFAGMALSLFGLGIIFLLKEHVGYYIMANLVLFIACFAIGPGLITSLVCSEISPPSIRGRAMGLAMFSNWTSNLAISALFLPLVQIWGSGSIFLVFAFLSLVGIVFVWRWVPETKGKTFEEIGRFWQKDN